jgi:hypothetical protein
MDTVSGDSHARLNSVVPFLAEVSRPDGSYCHYYSKPSLIRIEI